MRPKLKTFSSVEGDLVGASFAALNAINMTEPEALAAFDELAATGEPLSYSDLAQKHDSQRLARILCTVVCGYLVNWPRGGAGGLLNLHDHVQYFPPDDPDVEFQILSRALDLACPLARSHVAGEEQTPDETLLSMSESAGSFARFMCAHGHPDTAKELATFAVRLRIWAGAAPDGSLRRFALRMMNKADRQVFVRLTARAKYPPARFMGVPSDVLPQLVFRTVYSLFIGGIKNPQPGAAIASIDDFNQVARLMLEDRDNVVFMDVQFQYQYPGKPLTDSPVTRVEVRFSQPLLRRVNSLIVAEPGTTVTPYNLLIDLVAQLLVNQDDMEQQQDEYLFNWFVLRGAEPYRNNSFFRDGVIFVLCAPTRITVTIGETESDIEPWVRYGFLAEKSREFLRFAKSQLG